MLTNGVARLLVAVKRFASTLNASIAPDATISVALKLSIEAFVYVNLSPDKFRISTLLKFICKVGPYPAPSSVVKKINFALVSVGSLRPSNNKLFASRRITLARAGSLASLMLILNVPMVERLEWLELMILVLMVLIFAVVACKVVISKLATSRLSIVAFVPDMLVIVASSAVKVVQSTFVGLNVVVSKLTIVALVADKFWNEPLSTLTLVAV